MVTRRWLVLCVAVVWDSAFSKPTLDNGRSSVECCPCPKDAFGNPLSHSDAFGNPARDAFDDSLALDQSPDGTSGAGVRAAGPDSCPCRSRDADSVGSSSVFFPNAVRAVRPFVNLDSKEDPDPLLRPEVTLASSVLQTLRTVTDEEYQEALARDAARSADEEAAESRNLVTVIINPKDALADDDVMPEASHVHEARCVDSLARSSSRSSAYKPILLTDILNLPKRKSSGRSWSLFDLDNGVGASSINERVVEPFSNTDTVESEPNLPIDKPVKSLDKLRLKVPTFSSNVNSERSSVDSAPSKPIPSISNLLPKLPNLRRNEDDDLNSGADSLNAASAIKERFTGFTRDNINDNDEIITKPAFLPKANERSSVDSASSKSRTPLKIDISSISNLLPKLPNLRKNEDRSSDDLGSDSDSQNAASIIKERYSGFTRDKTKDDDNVIVKPNQSIVKPLFKNSDSFNFIPKSNMPLHKITPETRDAASDLLNGLLKGLEVPNLSNLFSSDPFNLRNSEQGKSTTEKEVEEVKPNDIQFKTEILDAIPSPSEIKSDHVSFSQVECESGINKKINTENEDVQKIIDQNPMKTEILDHLPKMSDATDLNSAESNIISDADDKAKENSDINNELINANDMIDDEMITADRESKLDSENLSEDTENDTSNDLFDIGAPELTNVDTPLNENQQNEIMTNVDETAPLPLRQRIRNRLENFKKRSKIDLNNLKPNKAEESKPIMDNNSAIEEEQFISPSQSEEEGKISAEILDTISSKESLNKINTEDLQQMSDSLLNKELDRQETNENDSKQSSSSELINKDQEFMEGQEDGGNVKSDNNPMEQNMSDSNNLDTLTDSSSNRNVCLESGPKIDLLDGNSGSKAKDNEMTFEASDQILNKLSPPLRQFPILQPPSFSDFNLLNPPTLDIESLLNLNNPLPKLKIPDIFKAKEVSDDIFSTRDDDDDLSIKKLKMSPSAPSFKSVLPPLSPLEDINLDILQLKPLGSEMPTLPRLNLNSFKTKLAMPESLQLRPLLLKSSVGNKKGVVGATLRFGNDKNSIGRANNMVQQASLKNPSILRRPLQLSALPSLNDLRDTVLENAQNILNTPLKTTSRNVVEDTLRSGQVLTENLRVEAENTVKDLHRNLQSTLKGVGLDSPGMLSSTSFKSPSDLLEEISRKHDDVNDKLKGIHYDLSDRLETFRNNILDDYKLPSLRSSIFDDMPTLSLPMPRESTSIRPKAKSSSISSKAKKVTNSNSGTKGKFISRTANKNQLKMPAAASVASAKTIKSRPRNTESPLLKSLGKEPTRTHLLSRERPPTFFQKTDKNIVDTNRPLLKKPPLPKWTQSKVKISFTTTELPPIAKSKGRLNELSKPKSSIKDSLSLPKLPKSAPRDKLGLLNSFKDSSGFASEPVSSRVKAPFSSRLHFKDLRPPSRLKMGTLDTDEDNLTRSTTVKPLTALTFARPKAPILNKVYSHKSPFTSESSMKPKSPVISDGTIDSVSTTKPLRNQQDTPTSWPKTIDDTFLTKVREALRARLAGISENLNTNPKLGDARKLNSLGKLTSGQEKTSPDTDMARSATNNIDVVEVAPGVMKEDTTYSCKMMCTKNS